MAKDDSLKTITVDVDTLKQLIESEVQKKLAAFATGSEADRFQKEMDAMRGKNVPPPKEDLLPCQSPLTGSTFNARVVYSKPYPKGRIVELPGYKEPPEASISEQDGGRVPRGMPILNEDGKPNVKYQQWKYATYWKRDLSEIVGQPMQSYYLESEYKAREASVKGAAE